MNKNAFLNSLREELARHNVQNIDEILSDYEEHFNHGLSKGKTEKEIALNLGYPATIASAYKTDKLIQDMKTSPKGFKWDTAFSIIGKLIILAPFNFFVLFIPGVIVLSLLVSGWCVAIAIGSVGIAGLPFLPTLATLSINLWAALAGFSFSMALIGLASLIGIVMFLITKYILLALINYLQWNLKFILQK